MTFEARVDGRLERAAPRLVAIAPRLRLAELPVRCVEAPALARAAGLGRLFIKRDDATSPIYGGTKVRALEFLLGAARAAGATGVATLGPEASHHVAAAAIFGSAAGFRVRAALFPQPTSPESAAAAERLAKLGVEIVRAPFTALMPWAAARARWAPLEGRRPFWIAAGASSPRGVLGAVEGALEVADDVAGGLMPAPEAVVVAAGSCGTAAGLCLGFALAGLGATIVAVRVTPRVVASRRKILSLARRAGALLKSAGMAGVDAALDRIRCEVDHAAYGPGYALPSEAATRAAAAAELHGGLRMETTYTGRALSVLFAPQFRGKTALYWHTYGAP
jgi:D-cysteine desulfhydrase